MNSLIANRIQTLLEDLDTLSLDAFLVLIAENRRYLSGYTGEDTQFDESAGALLISRDARMLITDSRFVEQARKEAPLYDIIRHQKGLIAALPDLLRRLKVRRLGIEGARMSYAQYVKMGKALESDGLDIDIQDTAQVVERQRMIKTEDEIAAIGKAVAAADADFEEFLHSLMPGITEKEAAWRVEQNLRNAGADALSFPVIAAFGKNSALPHAIPSHYSLKSGEPLLFDWGARVDGYCSDMTRTVCLGPPDETFRRIFTIVHDAQQKAIDAIRPGVHSKTIDDIARRHIRDKGFGDFFGHGLGHGVGLAVHEAPSISPLPEKNTILVENMVFTVEPGIYLPDWGGVRLENMVAVRSDGPEPLTPLPMRMGLGD